MLPGSLQRFHRHLHSASAARHLRRFHRHLHGAREARGVKEERLRQIQSAHARDVRRLEARIASLETDGWIVTDVQWPETLALPGGKSLAERWLATGSDYRTAIGDMDLSLLNELRRRIESLGPNGLRLTMQHHLVSGRRGSP